MFKPIKDFITFIQKNASTNSADNEMNHMESDEKSDSTRDLPVTVGKTENVNMDTIKHFPSEMSNDIASAFDEDDIELHIKSSIMLKNPPLKSSTPSPTPTTASSVSSVTSSTLLASCSKSYTADYNQNLQQKSISFSPEDDDELADFKNDPLQDHYEDFHSVHSELEEPQIHSADEAVDESRTEEDDAYSDDPVKREIFVVIDNDLNSSIASSSVDDPLAIDITTLPISSDEAGNPLDSSTNEDNDEVSSISRINWFDTEDKPTSNMSKTTLPSMEIEKISNITESQQTVEKRGNDSITLSRNEEPTEEMERCDNSDSGLGTETSSILQTTINSSITESSSYPECNRETVASVVDGSISTEPSPSTTTILSTAVPPLVRPIRSNLKRRYCDDTDVETNCLPGSSNTKEQDIYSSKKLKRSINFDTVQVYYFPRQQGFGCVPSAGGCTLGMGTQHVDFKRLTLAEHAAELRRAHRLQLQEVNPRGSSSEETDESEEDYLSEGSGSDLDADSNGFLQPVPPKQRRTILKAAGVRKIDTSEKIECRNIRNSREVCGCTCRDFCDPETCSCSQAGIKCQVDRAMFPCGCSRDACGNTTGRVEFNPARVRTHFIHTIMRLDMENRQQQQPMTMGVGHNNCGYDSTLSLSATSHSMTSGSSISNRNGYYNLQTQSNYSSGYASPAYSNEHNTNYYQQQSMTYASTTNETTNAVTSYQSLDNVDGSVFSNNTNNSVPAYGEISQNYCPNNSTGPLLFNNTGYHPSMTYTPTYLSYEHNQHHHDANSSYLTTPQHDSSNNNSNIVEKVESSYSSCAVPSQQPYCATTTCSLSTSTTTTTITTNASNFISLSTPIGSSSRLSQINDLLQHNRNTTAALVAISQPSKDKHPSTATSCVDNDANLKSSIETQSFNEKQKDCLLFGSDLTMAPLNPILEKQLSPQSESPSSVTATMPPIEYDSRVAVADYTI